MSLIPEVKISSYALDSSSSAEIDQQVLLEMQWEEKSRERKKRLNKRDAIFYAIGPRCGYASGEINFKNFCSSAFEFQAQIEKIKEAIQAYNAESQPELFCNKPNDNLEKTQTVQGNIALNWKSFELKVTWYQDSDTITLTIISSKAKAVNLVATPKKDL